MPTNFDELISEKTPETQNRITKILHESGVQDHDALWTIVRLIDAYSYEFSESSIKFEKSMKSLMEDSENQKKDILESINEYTQAVTQVALANLAEQISINEESFISILNDHMQRYDAKIKTTIKDEISKSAETFFIAEGEEESKNVSQYNYNIDTPGRTIIRTSVKIILMVSLVSFGVIFSDQIVNAIQVIR